jgi:hypothetical protein
MFWQHIWIGKRERRKKTDNEGAGTDDERGFHDGTSLWTA